MPVAIFGSDYVVLVTGACLADAGSRRAGADGLANLTEWREISSPDFDHLQAGSKHSVIFGGRTLYNPEPSLRSGFSYYAVGQGLDCGEMSCASMHRKEST